MITIFRIARVAPNGARPHGAGSRRSDESRGNCCAVLRVLHDERRVAAKLHGFKSQPTSPYFLSDESRTPRRPSLERSAC